MKHIEANIDTLVGPTHFYGGLSFGNIASTSNKALVSYPKKAALQGLEKMKLLSDLGIPQLILPPHPRPHIAMLKRLGFSGSEQQIIEQAYSLAPEILIQCSSSSAMWTANSAVVTPSSDSQDGKVHITPANLASHFHRSLEASFTSLLFKAIFHDGNFFTHHHPLPATSDFFDEGAANYTRFSDRQKGLHLFVYGKSSALHEHSPTHYPARQSKEAQEAVVRLHKLDPQSVLFAQQNPTVIDQGVFHNDVIATGNQELFLLHEEAYVNTAAVIEALQEKAHKTLKKELSIALIKKEMMPVSDAVRSYLFNSQIVSIDNRQILIAPSECEQVESAKEVINFLLRDKKIDKALFISINQSMKNGGGPACLRLRLPLTSQELAAVHPGVLFSQELYSRLKICIENGYPDHFTPTDLLDHQFRKNIKSVQKKIINLLKLPF